MGQVPLYMYLLFNSRIFSHLLDGETYISRGKSYVLNFGFIRTEGDWQRVPVWNKRSQSCLSDSQRPVGADRHTTCSLMRQLKSYAFVKRCKLEQKFLENLLVWQVSKVGQHERERESLAGH